MITTQKLAKQMCELEVGEEEVNIAQMNEIISKLPILLYNNRREMPELMEYLFKHFIKEGYDVHTNTSRLNGFSTHFSMSVHQAKEKTAQS